jgi:hypothetical protein
VRLSFRVQAALILLVAASAEGAAPDAIPPNVLCGDDYWFTLDEPAGWSTEDFPGGETLGLLFLPPGHTGGEPTLSMELTLALSSGSHKTDVRLDIHEELEHWAAQINMLGPMAFRAFDADHPTLPTAGRQATFERGSLYVVLVDALSGRGNAFTARLVKQGGAATAAELDLFRRMIASIDFEATRACGPGPNRTAVATRLPGPSPAAAVPKEPRLESGFDFQKAVKGCGVLHALFVPAYCREETIEGNAALLVYIDDDDGTEPATTYLERFREPIAGPFCYEAARHPKDAPRLVFYAENSPVAHEYDCRARRLGRIVSLPEGM